MGLLLLGVGLFGVALIFTLILWLDGDNLIKAFVDAVVIVGVITIAVVSVTLVFIGAALLLQGLFF